MKIATALTLALMALAPSAHAAGIETLARRHPANASVQAAVYVNGPAVVYLGGTPVAAPTFSTYGVRTSRAPASIPVGARRYAREINSVSFDPAAGQQLSRGFWRSRDQSDRGLLRAAYRSSTDTHGAMSQAFDPIVDPVLGSSMNAVGTTAGVVAGAALYGPLKVLEHLY